MTKRLEFWNFNPGASSSSHGLNRYQDSFNSPKLTSSNWFASGQLALLNSLCLFSNVCFLSLFMGHKKTLRLVTSKICYPYRVIFFLPKPTFLNSELSSNCNLGDIETSLSFSIPHSHSKMMSRKICRDKKCSRRAVRTFVVLVLVWA